MAATVPLWASDRLRLAWQAAISHKAVKFFEAIAAVADESRFWTKQELADATGVGAKYIDRLQRSRCKVSILNFLGSLQLLTLTRHGNSFSITTESSVNRDPPTLEMHELPIWASFERDPRRHVDRAELYDKDGGRCGYCGLSVPLGECNLDHIWPFEKLGLDDADNLVVQCKAHSCRSKWLHVPGCAEFMFPRWYRRQTVRAITFAKKNGVFVPSVIASF